MVAMQCRVHGRLPFIALVPISVILTVLVLGKPVVAISCNYHYRTTYFAIGVGDEAKCARTAIEIDELIIII
jgi:hypothetical protein